MFVAAEEGVPETLRTPTWKKSGKKGQKGADPPWSTKPAAALQALPQWSASTPSWTAPAAQIPDRSHETCWGWADGSCKGKHCPTGRSHFWVPGAQKAAKGKGKDTKGKTKNPWQQQQPQPKAGGQIQADSNSKASQKKAALLATSKGKGAKGPPPLVI